MRSGPSSPRRRSTATGTNPADDERGDNWDHVAFDPEHRLVVSVVPGRRSPDHVRLSSRIQQRTEGRLMNLMTTDEYPAYAEAILDVYGERPPPPRRGPGRPPKPVKVPPPGLKYAVVHKTRENGRVVKVEPRVVFGTVVAVLGSAGGVLGEQGGEHVLHRAAQRH